MRVAIKLTVLVMALASGSAVAEPSVPERIAIADAAMQASVGSERINVLASACPIGSEATKNSDLIVCGSGPSRSRYQIPLPQDRGLRTRPQMATGTVLGGMDALGAMSPPIPSCSHPEAGYHCSGNLDLFKIAKVVGMVVELVPKPTD